MVQQRYHYTTSVRFKYKLYLEKKRRRSPVFDILERGGAYIELIELAPSSSKDELNKKCIDIARRLAGPAVVSKNFFYLSNNKWRVQQT